MLLGAEQKMYDFLKMHLENSDKSYCSFGDREFGELLGVSSRTIVNYRNKLLYHRVIKTRCKCIGGLTKTMIYRLNKKGVEN